MTTTSHAPCTPRWPSGSGATSVPCTRGVATGEVLRRIGPDGASAIGDPVRVATALRHAAGPGEILVGERALGTARRGFALTATVDRASDGALALRAAVLVGHGPGGPPRRRAFVGRGDELDA